MKRHPLAMPPFYDSVACVDFETFWDSGFTLTSKTMSMTDYVRDPRFEAQSVSVMHESWKEAQVAVGYREIKELLHEIDWARTAFLGHHTHFDGFIATEKFGVYPAFWLDNMSISRAVYGVGVAHSHLALAGRLGIEAKKNAGALKETKGKYLRDMSPETIEALRVYNKDDAEEELAVFRKIWQYLPFDELRIIDITLRMYCEPLLLLDGERLQALYEREEGRRAALVEEAGTSQAVLGSAPKFADLLRSLGVVPPMKISRKTKQPAYAFAKTDLEFKSLLSHPNEAVRKAVAARLGNKGSIVASRSKRLAKRAGLPTPVYLAYAAAITQRWGGGDLSNWQNLPSTGDGANIRRAILAPPGTLIIGADASQVEARMVAWIAKFVEKMAAFTAYDQGRGPDLYCVAASGVFGRTILKKEDPFERFIGKVLELMCQYGAGPLKVQHALAQGFRGAAPVYMELRDVKTHVQNWRHKANAPVTQAWKDIERAARTGWIHEQETEYSGMIFEKVGNTGYMHMPNGTFLQYPGIDLMDGGDMYYNSRNGAVKLWGGHLLENGSQALCAVLLKEHMIKIAEALEELRIVLLVHDEIVGLANKDDAHLAAQVIKSIMSTSSDWCPDLPLNAAATVGEYYDKPE